MTHSREQGIAPWAAFAACCAIWGSTFLFIRIGNDSVAPVWAATLRLGLATLILFPLAWGAGGGLPRGAALRAALGYGIFQFGLNFPLLYWGETRVPSGLAAVLFATIPLITPLVARAFGLERLQAGKIFGAVVALAGVAMIFAGRITARAAALPLAAVFLAAAAASVGPVLLKRGPRQNPFGANAIACLVGLPICLALSFALGESHALPLRFGAIFPILYLTLAGSVGAFVILAWLVNHWPVTNIVFIAVITPLVALALGALFRDERLVAADLIGAVLVLAGVGLATWSERAHVSGGS